MFQASLPSIFNSTSIRSLTGRSRSQQAREELSAPMVNASFQEFQAR